MPEVDVKGQKKLKAASVFIIGARGLGSPPGIYLAVAHVGCIEVVDYDMVDLSNFLVVDSTGNLPTRYLLSDLCVFT